MIVLVVSMLLACTPIQPKPVKPKPSPEYTFKQRWLALHFRERAQ